MDGGVMEELVESILDYVRSDYTDYAVMINGEWGSGKTHFWNNKIRKKIESMQLNGKKYTTIYMSLYGISNLEEISKKIFIETTQLMDKNLNIQKLYDEKYLKDGLSKEECKDLSKILVLYDSLEDIVVKEIYFKGIGCLLLF